MEYADDGAFVSIEQELCIIPFEAAVPVFPLNGFRLYDDLVIVESIVGDAAARRGR